MIALGVWRPHQFFLRIRPGGNYLLARRVSESGFHTDAPRGVPARESDPLGRKEHMNSSEGSILRASPGDRLVVRGHHQGELPRDGEILKVLGDDGAPPYLVRWEDGHESEVFPGSDIFIQHFDSSEEK